MVSRGESKREEVYAKLCQSLSESEASLVNYLQSLNLLVEASKQKMVPFENREDAERARNWNGFHRSVAKGLSTISDFQRLMLEKAKLLGERERGSNTPHSLVGFLTKERPEFSRCVMSMEQMLSKNSVVRRYSATAIRHVSRYSTEKADLRRTLFTHQPNELWTPTGAIKHGSTGYPGKSGKTIKLRTHSTQTRKP